MTSRITKGWYRTCMLVPAFLCFVLVSGCGTDSSQGTASEPGEETAAANPRPVAEEAQPRDALNVAGPSIEIKEDSPADTVRAFYDRLRNRQYVAAMKLTNLRPAVEGLSEAEIKDLGVDFGELARSVPSQMPINGEIVSGNEATVTMKMPNEKDGKLETSEIKLRKEGGNWVMLVADAEGEKMVRREGKNYFFALRMEVHHREALAMIERINKAQGIYALQNGGKFADLETLIGKGYVPGDASSAESTGYHYKVALAYDKSTYTVHAYPAAYRKSGTLSFASRIRKGKDPELTSRDTKGRILQN